MVWRFTLKSLHDGVEFSCGGWKDAQEALAAYPAHEIVDSKWIEKGKPQFLVLPAKDVNATYDAIIEDMKKDGYPL